MRRMRYADELPPDVYEGDRREMTFTHFYGTDACRGSAAHPSDDDTVGEPGAVEAQWTVLIDRRPDTILQSLMETSPGETPQVSKEELAALGPLLVDAIDTLDERDRFIFDRLVVERMSLRGLAEMMGLSKTHLHRERKRIMRVLRGVLADQPLIQLYLDR